MSQKQCKVQQISYLKDFHCLGPTCSDNCCISNWIIDVTDENKKLYEAKAPDVNADVEQRDSGGFKMKKSLNSDCVWFDEKDRFCGVQKKYGEEFLPDICYFFPKSHKKFADEIYMTSNLACPEALRVALFNNDQNGFSIWDEVVQNRERQDLYDNKIDGFSELSHQQIIGIFNAVAKLLNNKNFSADQSLARLVLIASYLDESPIAEWENIKERLFDRANKKEINKIARDNLADLNSKNEMNNILKAIFVVINRDRPRYNFIIKIIREYLGDDGSEIEEVIENYQKIKEFWQKNGEENFQPLMKNLLKMQLSYALFPIACYFRKKSHSMLNIALEYLVIKLAMMVRFYELGGKMSESEITDTIQPIGKRFYVRKKQEILDHCKDSGWEDQNKLVSLILNF